MDSTTATELARAWGPVWTLIIGVIGYLCWRLWQLERRYHDLMTNVLGKHETLLKESMRAEHQMAGALDKLSDLVERLVAR